MNTINHSEDAVTEGFAPFHDFRIWYRIVGNDTAPNLPLLCLHGGPGSTWDYLEPLEAIKATGRRVIFFDQLGNGNSDRPYDPSLWTVDLFVRQVDAVRQALGLDQVHLYGSSWGGQLAMEYALTRPAGLTSLIVASSPASVPQWIAEANRLRADLPPQIQQTLLKHEQAGTTDDPAYEEAAMAYYRRHLCRLDPWPNCLLRSDEALMANPHVYHSMWGPSEFHCTGLLRDWDIVDRLGEIRVPTLVTSGRYDEATPAIAETVHRGIPDSEWVLFVGSSHVSHIEETDRYLRVLGQFLRRVEEQPWSGPV